ncbi:MAG: cytochrome c oxidase accessory protein CcoG [Helicobacteraceae bacterium]|jgi:cytochrome c oxidase accessory protein FixG|nr:cytochrome c oxidase accessory protein CcoG [Helicobacteraceae bacterium]
MNRQYRKLRWAVMLFATLFTIGLPFVVINDHHFFLLSFEHAKLHLFFVGFDAQELYLMPFVLMFGFLFVFAITTLGGRVWCGWGCPQTIYRAIYRDLIEGWLLKMHRLANRQKEVDYSLFSNKIKKIAAIAIWIPLAFLAAANLTWFFVPPEEFFPYMTEPLKHPVLLGMQLVIAGFLIFDITKMGETFCSMICPYVRVQSSMYDRDTVYTIYDEKRGGKIYEDEIKLGKKPFGANDECTGCEMCVHICPAHIDIRRGLQLECINCLDCADACAVVMDKLGKKSLVNWTSSRQNETGEKTRFLRFRTIAYAFLLACVATVLLIMSGEKESFLLNITKSQRPYKIEADADAKSVQNEYIFLFTNKSETAHKYYFEVVSPSGIKIVTPLKALNVEPYKKERMIVLLSADEGALAAGKNMLRVEAVIRAYSEDDPAQSITRKALFFYPPQSELTK